MKSILISLSILLFLSACQEKSIDTDLLYGIWEVDTYKVYQSKRLTDSFAKNESKPKEIFTFKDSLHIYQNSFNVDINWLKKSYYSLRLKEDSILFREYDLWTHNGQLIETGNKQYFVVQYLDSTKLTIDYSYSLQSDFHIEFELTKIDTPMIKFNLDSLRIRLHEFDSALLLPAI